MELVIAVVLMIILFFRLLPDKVGQSEYKHRKNEWERTTKDFAEHYTNKQLEDAIRQAFSDDTQLPAIRNEVNMAFQQMESWRGERVVLCTSDFTYPKGKFTQKAYRENTEQMYRDRHLAMDILLANRGKVSSDSNRSGYNSYLNTEYQALKEQQYELVEWIQNTLKKQGVSITPVCVDKTGSRYYAWLGSFAAPDPPFATETARLPFERHLIERKKITIPAPSYEQ